MITSKGNITVGNTDIKVLGRVISISTANGGNGIVADALLVWDTGFDKLGVTNGANQNYINDLIAGYIKKLIDAGIMPDANGNIVINDPVTFNEDITLGNGVEIGPNLSVTGNITAGNNINASHTITGNTITSSGNLNGVTLNISGNSNIAGNETIGGKLIVNGGADIHGAFKAFDGATFDGDVVVNNLTVNGTFNAPHATTTKYGIVRLATGLVSNADDDVVPVSLLRTYINQLLDNPNTAAIDSIKELLDKINANEALIPTKLNDLDDVTSANIPNAGDILYYNGSSWTNTSFQTLFDNAIQNYLNSINNNIAAGNLWKISSNGNLVPKTDGTNVATSGIIYSGVATSNL